MIHSRLLPIGWVGVQFFCIIRLPDYWHQQPHAPWMQSG
jgi:hypothetical protein